jgi:hypothetical protein
LQREAVVAAEFDATISFLALHYLGVELLFHPVEDDRLVVFVVPFHFADRIADLGFEQGETVVQPGFQEVGGLFPGQVRQFDQIVFA